MIFENAFDHVLAPVDEFQMQALRNAALCGVLAFAFIIVGVNQLLTLLIYFFAIAFACVAAWLYSLTPNVRDQVLGRIRDVIRAFWRKCVDESFTDGPIERTNAGRRRRDVSTCSEVGTGRDTAEGVCAEQTRDSEDHARRIDLLAKDFTGLFNVSSEGI